MDNETPITTFTTMLYNQRHLIIETTGDRRVVIAETYLPDNAALICQLLTDHAGNQSTKDNGEKQNDK